MADATTTFFSGLGARGHEPLLRKTTGTLRFDLEDGKRIERWLVAIKRGDVAVSHRNVRADCVVSTDRALFEEVATGKANAMAALLRGAVAVEGDVQLIVPFQRLFPGPRRTRKRRHTGADPTRRKR
jgi:SCP-2 sterol transfer family